MDSAWAVLRTSVAEGAKAPAARGGHTATLVEKNLLVQGGQQHKSAGVFEYFSLNPTVLDTETHTWFVPRVALGKGPTPRAYHTTTRIGSHLYVFGGSTAKKAGESGLLGDLVLFDLVRMAWEARDVRGKKPRARFMHTTELCDGKLFVFGGSDGSRTLTVRDTTRSLTAPGRANRLPLNAVAARSHAARAWHRLAALAGCQRVRLRNHALVSAQMRWQHPSRLAGTLVQPRRGSHVRRRWHDDRHRRGRALVRVPAPFRALSEVWRVGCMHARAPRGVAPRRTVGHEAGATLMRTHAHPSGRSAFSPLPTRARPHPAPARHFRLALAPAGRFVKYSNDVYSLHTQTMEWTRLRQRGEQPSARAYHAAAVVGNFLVLLGGWSGACEGLKALSTLDLDGLGTWASVAVPGQAPVGVYGHTATVLGSNILIFGGWDGVSPLSAVNVLDTTKL